MGPAAERFAQLTAHVFLGAAGLEIVLIAASLLADARLVPVPESVFNTAQCPVIFTAFAAALTYLIVTGGGRRRPHTPIVVPPPADGVDARADVDVPSARRRRITPPVRTTSPQRTFVTAVAWAIVLLTSLLVVFFLVASILFALTMSDF